MRQITQRELRNETPAVMRAIEAGESFVLTRNGTPIADLIPHVRATEPRGVTGAALVAAREQCDAIEPERFFADLERYVDEDPLGGPGEPKGPR